MKEVSSQKSVVNATADPTSDDTKLPASRKIYVETNGLRVPFREIELSPSKAMDGTLEENPSVRVYDTSGPWTDPEQKLDVRDGLPPLRVEWVKARGDVEERYGDEGTERRGDAGTRGRGETEIGKRPESEPGAVATGSFAGSQKPLRARDGACVTQMHYARKGIITPEMEYVAIRENQGRQIAFQKLQESTASVAGTTPASQSLGHPS
jgi:phosphomethylpyrimidine synthase